MSTFEDVVSSRACIEKFKDNCVSQDNIDEKIENYQSNKLKRYFFNHKGRTFFMALCIILLFVCALTEYPIDGSINSDDTFSKFMSVVGFISANVFLALLFTILGVETYMSQEELKEIKSYLPNVIALEIEKKKSNPAVLDYLQNILSKKSKKKYVTRKIAVEKSNTTGRGESDIELTNILDFIKILSTSELTKIYEDLKKFNK
jgi:predicted nucleic acid-binding protein